MEQFDMLFFSVFQHYKPKYKTKANDIALFYILMLQASVLLLLGTFFMLFFNGMNVDVLSVSKAWILYVVTVIALIFRNWIYYTGKKRKVLNTKLNKTTSRESTNIWVLWMIPIACFILAIFLMQRL
jgi:small-conductance mechanosensitive channel